MQEVMTQASAFIANLGFPIFCCVVLFYQNKEVRSVLNEINATMQVLVNELGDIKRKVDE